MTHPRLSYTKPFKPNQTSHDLMLAACILIFIGKKYV